MTDPVWACFRNNRPSIVNPSWVRHTLAEVEADNRRRVDLAHDDGGPLILHPCCPALPCGDGRCGWYRLVPAD